MTSLYMHTKKTLTNGPKYPSSWLTKLTINHEHQPGAPAMWQPTTWRFRDRMWRGGSQPWIRKCHINIRLNRNSSRNMLHYHYIAICNMYIYIYIYIAIYCNTVWMKGWCLNQYVLQWSWWWSFTRKDQVTICHCQSSNLRDDGRRAWLNKDDNYQSQESRAVATANCFLPLQRMPPAAAGSCIFANASNALYTLKCCRTEKLHTHWKAQ